MNNACPSSSLPALADGSRAVSVAHTVGSFTLNKREGMSMTVTIDNSTPSIDGGNMAPLLASYTASLELMHNSDGTAENRAVDFVRDGLAAVINGALSIDDVAATIVAKYAIVTKGGKSPKATIAGIKNGVGKNGRDCQALAHRLATVDYVARNVDKVRAMVEAFIADDLPAMRASGLLPAMGRVAVSVNGLKMAVEAAVKAHAKALIGETEEPDAGETEATDAGETEATDAAPLPPPVRTLADDVIALAARLLASSDEEYAATSDAFSILHTALIKRAKDAQDAVKLQARA